MVERSPRPGPASVLLLAFAGAAIAAGCGDVLTVSAMNREADSSTDAGEDEVVADVYVHDASIEAAADVHVDAGSCRSALTEDFNGANDMDERWRSVATDGGAFVRDTAEFHGAMGAALRVEVGAAGGQASVSRAVGGECPFAMRFWFKHTPGASKEAVFGRLRVGTETVSAAFDGANVRLDASPANRVWTGAPADGGWHEILLTYRSDARTAGVSIDGAVPATITLPPGNAAVEELGLGLLYVTEADRLFIDDLRIE